MSSSDLTADYPFAGVVVAEIDANAGHSALTIAVANLEAEVAALRSRGVEPGPVEPVGTVGVESKLADPDGNQLTLVEIRAG